jgi:excisionase family DNA binding protein
MLIKANEAARILAVKTPRLYQLVRENVVPYVRLGERQIRFNEDALKDWINRGGLTQSNGNGAEHSERLVA